MTARSKLLSDRVKLAEAQAGQPEMRALEMISNKLAAQSAARSGGFVTQRHERRIETVRSLLGERLRLERVYPLGSADVVSWYDDLVADINEIINRNVAHLERGLRTDWGALGGPPPDDLGRQFGDEIDRLRRHHLSEADIIRQERQLESPKSTTTSGVTLNISGSLARSPRLDKEQTDLLTTLVEAYRSHREPFLVLEASNALGQVIIRHPAVDNQGVPAHDLQMLLREDLLLITQRGEDVWWFVPTPEAVEYYREASANATLTGPTKTLADYIRDRNLEAIGIEFERALANVDADPGAAATAASAVVEAVCKVIIAEEKLSMPSDQSIQSLWRIVQNHLNLDPSKATTTDLRQILSGLISIVHGVGAFRTHAGSAHGGAALIEPRHARLAVHAAHTLTMFALESWRPKH